ncbi:hypothetical protein D3C87_1457330 [compost metagenome]
MELLRVRYLSSSSGVNPSTNSPKWSRPNRDEILLVWFFALAADMRAKASILFFSINENLYFGFGCLSCVGPEVSVLTLRTGSDDVSVCSLFV